MLDLMRSCTVAFVSPAPVISRGSLANVDLPQCRRRKPPQLRPRPMFEKRGVMALEIPQSTQEEYEFGGNRGDRNAGEECIEQLARQSAQRRSASAGQAPLTGKQTADAYMDRLSSLTEANSMRDNHVSDENMGPLNASDEYLAQLARQSAKESASRQEFPNVPDYGDEKQGRNAGEEYIAQLAKQSASKAANAAPQKVTGDTPAPVRDEDDAAIAAVDAEIARLRAEVAELENALSAVTENEESEASAEDESALEVDQRRSGDVTAEKSPGLREDPVGASKDPVQNLESYNNMREMLNEHVTPPSAPSGYSDVETTSFEEAPMREDVDQAAKSENSVAEGATNAELAMVEIQMEMERYKVVARNVLEKHEQHIQTIIEKYMPGL